MPNTENINRFIDHLRKDGGEHFMMTDYIQFLDDANMTDQEEDDGFPHRWVDCGTACCLAGWANFFILKDNGKNPKEVEGADFYRYFSRMSTAAEWLGIENIGNADSDLFLMHSSDIKRSDFDDLPATSRNKAAIRVLEILRDESRVDWNAAIDFATGQ